MAYSCCTIKFFLPFTSIQLNLRYSMAHYSLGLDSLPAREPCDLCKPFQEKNKLWNCRYIKICLLLIFLCVFEVLLQEHFCRITHLGWLSLIMVKCSFKCFFWLAWIAGSRCVLTYYSSMHFNMGELRFKCHCLCHWIGFAVGYFAFSEWFSPDTVYIYSAKSWQTI